MAARRRREAYRVFISHSHKDRWIARQVVKLIEEAGGGRIHAFLDERDIEGGEPIAERVLKEIRKCNEFMVLLSQNSKDRPWVLIEIGVACGRGKPIIAILNDVTPKEMPEIMYPYKAIDLNDFDQYLDQVRKRMKKGPK
jgi:nucleoside 2-deoxyribosyltransferase